MPAPEQQPAEEWTPDHAQRRRFRRGLVLLFALALALRLAFQLELGESPLLRLPFGGGAYYHAWGVALAEGRAPEGVFYHAPLYPYFLAGLYRTVGVEPTLVRLLQATFGAASCVLLAAAAARLLAPRPAARTVGLTAGALLALNPNAILYEIAIKKTSLGLLLLVLFLALLGRFRARPTGRVLLGAGLALGLAGAIRENTLALAPVVLVWLALAFRERTTLERARWCAWFAVGLLLVPITVGVRNRAAAGELVLGTTNSGANFYIGNHEGASGLFEPLVRGHGGAAHDPVDARRIAEREGGRALTAREVSGFWWERAWTGVSANPTDWFALLGRKTTYLVSAQEWADDYNLAPFRDASLVLRATRPAGFGILLALAVPGAVLGLRRGRHRSGTTLLLAGVLVLGASVAAFFVVDRFRLSLVPLLAPFAALTLVELATRVRARETVAALRLVVCSALPIAAVHLVPRVEEWPRAATYNFLGRALVDEDRIEEGLSWFERALEERPESPEAHFNAGDALLRLGRDDEATEHLDQAAQLEPGYLAWALRRLGVHAAREGDLARALELLQNARALDAGEADHHYDVALVLRALGRWDEAEAAYRAAIELRPDHADAHNNLGYLLELQGRDAEALREYESAVAADPGHARTRVNLAWILATRESLRDGDAALAHARRAGELTEGGTRLDETLAAAHAAAGDAPEAARLAEELLVRLRAAGDVQAAERVERALAAYRAGAPFTLPE